LASSTDNGRWLAAAVALAWRGVGRTFPNPSVGCLLVKDGRVVGRGWTQPGGRPHAEAMALAEAGAHARGATAYVSLEPCAHASARGPDCATLLATAGVMRVVAARGDPDPRTNGAGFARLRAAGVSVERTSQGSADLPAAGFLTRQALGRPHVTLKLALSLDGAVAMADGSSRWITGPGARAHAHGVRARSELILVGRGTLEADRPGLDVRLQGLADRAPIRVVLGRGSPPPGWMGIHSPAEIAALPGDFLLVEGGAITAAAFLAADLVDRLLLYRAPILVGGGRTLPDIGLARLDAAHGRWRLADVRTLGSDRLEVYERRRD
jgi:diaminohydroxyphosphoribosylaminopyrimidine deaminase / 5-amino-6-(5-phosphoribosylamino)uracil reductase